MIQLKVLNKQFYEKHDLPSYATPGSAGVDLRACIDDPITLGHDYHPLNGGYERDSPAVKINTGLAMHLKNLEMCAIILPRSGLGHHGIILGNGVGLLDSDYQGELLISLYNRTKNAITINPGDRVAQMVFLPIIKPLFEIVEEFELSERGSNGFGSTGR